MSIEKLRKHPARPPFSPILGDAVRLSEVHQAEELAELAEADWVSELLDQHKRLRLRLPMMTKVTVWPSISSPRRRRHMLRLGGARPILGLSYQSEDQERSDLAMQWICCDPA